MWFEGGLEDETDFLDSARRDVEVVGTETEGEFAGGGLPLFAVGGGDEFRSGCEGGCVVFGSGKRGDNLAVFDGAAELVPGADLRQASPLGRAVSVGGYSYDSGANSCLTRLAAVGVRAFRGPFRVRYFGARG